MVFRRCVFFVLLFLPTILCCEIRECSSIEDVLGEVKPDTLFIFDIDNTLMRPCQVLGSDEWVDYFWKKKEKEGVSGEELRRNVIEIWVAIQVLTKMQLIESGSPAVVEKLQKMHVPVMALSSRSEPVARTTRLQLQSLGIDMSKSPIMKTNFCLADAPAVWFGDGVLFTAGRDKGKMLMSFFQEIKYTPRRVVFIDDKKSCLEAVEKQGEGSFQFVGLRYNRADQVVKAFDPALAEVELEYLQNGLLSDEEASRSSIYTQTN